jgi:predicted AlkP superfamily pyrophosphatase or phosphodiesterase
MTMTQKTAANLARDTLARGLPILAGFLLAAAMPARAADVLAQHVLVIGVDGLSPAGIRDAPTPVLDELCARGAFSMHARAVMPTSSSPNWASMIMGAGPEQHGITSNDWERDRYDVAPVARGPEGIFPTIFGTIRRHRPEGAIGVFHDWDGFGRLVEKQSCDAVEDADGPLDATRRASAFLKSRKPILTFVHLDHVDHAGHSHGWGSPEYLQAVEEADRLIGELLRALDEAGMGNDTVVIVSADHGGKGTGHGGATMDEIEIPWIIVGPRIHQGHELKGPINQYDTSATVTRALGASPPDSWIGRPVGAAWQ